MSEIGFRQENKCRVRREYGVPQRELASGMLPELGVSQQLRLPAARNTDDGQQGCAYYDL